MQWWPRRFHRSLHRARHGSNDSRVDWQKVEQATSNRISDLTQRHPFKKSILRDQELWSVDAHLVWKSLNHCPIGYTIIKANLAFFPGVWKANPSKPLKLGRSSKPKQTNCRWTSPISWSFKRWVPQVNFGGAGGVVFQMIEVAQHGLLVWVHWRMKLTWFR